jgi:glucose dehydrogenase
MTRTRLRAAFALIVALGTAGCGPSDRDESQGAESTEPAPTADAAAPIEADPATEWRYYNGNAAAQHYSPIDQIDRDNVGDLSIAWRFGTGNFGPSSEQKNETTPLVINGVLYTSVGTTRNVVALDPTTGETLWLWRPPDGGERYDAAPRKTSGRGLAYWTDGQGNERLLVVLPDFYLVALDPATGYPIVDFGNDGIVDLMVGVRGEVNEDSSIGNSSPPMVVGDTVVVGPAHDVAFFPPSRANIKGDVRGYDVRTGERRWTFHTIPEAGEPGYETWLDGSAEYTGNAGVWAPMAADTERGLVYLPVEGALGDFYGGARPGDNLFGSSLVCLDAETGELVWYFQTVHHDIWDWDNPTSPILMDITVDGETIPAVAQLTKQAFVYTFNRVTGEPVWPIEERPVAASDVPGEWTSPTQPFPTKPAAFDRQGFSADDLIDFTPELRAEALEGIAPFRIGPIFTPPSVPVENGNQGTLGLPSATGGGNWEGGNFDPETGLLYVGSYTNPYVYAVRPNREGAEVPFIYGGGGALPFLDGLPLVKPPYGRITAIDMNTGEHAWMVANGPTPDDIANHPRLDGVEIPATGRPTRAMLLTTKTLLFATDGWGGTPVLRALDKATGETIAEIDLPGASGGLPMTYAIDGRQFITVSVAGTRGAELVALALPARGPERGRGRGNQ